LHDGVVLAVVLSAIVLALRVYTVCVATGPSNEITQEAVALLGESLAAPEFADLECNFFSARCETVLVSTALRYALTIRTGARRIALTAQAIGEGSCRGWRASERAEETGNQE
jgi:hypothetical protein